MCNRFGNPCDCCSTPCEGLPCDNWQRWFVKKWNSTTRKIHRCLWKKMDNIGKQGYHRKFRYALPHEYTDPCKECICRQWCDTPCSLRLKWWDVSMARIRKALAANGKHNQMEKGTAEIIGNIKEVKNGGNHRDCPRND